RRRLAVRRERRRSGRRDRPAALRHLLHGFSRSEAAMNARPVAGDRELEQILELQRANLARNLSPQDAAGQGFVTVEHSLDVLRRMHAIAPSIVAMEGEE